MICNSWYWLTDGTGQRYKVCSMNYNCPKDAECGMRNSEFNKKGEEVTE